MSALTLSSRYATLQDLAQALETQHARKVDVVAPAAAIRSEMGIIQVAGMDQFLDDDGVTTIDGAYRGTEIFHGQLASVLKLPGDHLRKWHADRPDIYDEVVNRTLNGGTGSDGTPYEGDGRSFLLRMFADTDGGIGVIRAVLSDRFNPYMDHLDILVAVLKGIQEAGAEVSFTDMHLSEQRMHLSVAAPGVAALAPVLLGNYKNPFTDDDEAPGRAARRNGWTLEAARAAARREAKDYPEGQEPVVFAGFDIDNSELGGGAWSLRPRLTIQACKNGLTLDAANFRRVHLGGQLDDGLVKRSAATERRFLELIASQTTDAVGTYLDVEFVKAQIATLETKAGKPVTDAAATIETVTKQLAFSEEERALVLDYFIRGAQMTAGGVMQAVAAAAQMVPDPDRALDMEHAAVQAMDLAAAL